MRKLIHSKNLLLIAIATFALTACATPQEDPPIPEAPSPEEPTPAVVVPAPTEERDTAQKMRDFILANNLNQYAQEQFEQAEESFNFAEQNYEKENEISKTYYILATERYNAIQDIALEKIEEERTKAITDARTQAIDAKAESYAPNEYAMADDFTISAISALQEKEYIHAYELSIKAEDAYLDATHKALTERRILAEQRYNLALEELQNTERIAKDLENTIKEEISEQAEEGETQSE